MIAKIDNLIENLKSLTLVEAVELVKQIESTFGVDTSVQPVSNVSTTSGTIDSSTPDTEEQTEFSVVLEEVPSAKKIAILKVVRSMTGLGLKDAKTLVESYPKTVKDGLTKNDADDMKQKLEEVGAKIGVK